MRDSRLCVINQSIEHIIVRGTIIRYSGLPLGPGPKHYSQSPVSLLDAVSGCRKSPNLFTVQVIMRYVYNTGAFSSRRLRSAGGNCSVDERRFPALPGHAQTRCSNRNKADQQQQVRIARFMLPSRPFLQIYLLMAPYAPLTILGDLIKGYL